MAFSEEEYDYAQWLFKQSCTFMRGVTSLQQLPEFDLPEIAFAGRSNVGKSSLINGLLGRKDIARTSNTPGRTQQLNFFNINDAFYLVDMPGYGYAEAPKKIVIEWQKLIKQYLLGRPTLERVYVLIDSRHGIKENDTDFMTMLDQTAVSYQIVLTKIDKIGKAALDAVLENTTKTLLKHGAAHPVVLVTSSEKNQGMDLVRVEIAQFCKK